MRPLVLATSLLFLLPGCASTRSPYGSVDASLDLDTVVLYRNGVGYFERRGEVDGDVLRIRVRKDQVNDLLKSLTVVDDKGRAVSVSMPLDPQTWANAALAKLGPGRGSLASVLDAMRGTEVTLNMSGGGSRTGRIVMVERTVNEPDPTTNTRGGVAPQGLPDSRDYKITILEGAKLKVVRLSKVVGVRLQNGDLALQVHRSLDAAAGEGMFEQVEINIRLVGSRSHGLTVSYVVEAPMWKPTYRVVLPEAGKGPALLQGWAVVDNISGEDWNDVSLSLTSGAPIAFQYDLHTPRTVGRADMTGSGVRKRARVSMGETTWEADDSDEEAGGAGRHHPATDPAPEAEPEMAAAEERWADKSSKDSAKKKGKRKPARTRGPGGGGAFGSGAADGDWYAGGMDEMAEAQNQPSLDLEALRRSTMASARSKRVTGLTRVDLMNEVTVPDGTSTMVAILNESVDAEQTFLYKPGGAGTGYENNPYRVVRFQNTTDYVLEPGPISIYSGGSFVGEGLSEAVGAKTSVTIPFAVESGVMVETTKQYAGDEMRIVKIVGGVLEVETYYRTVTSYSVKGQPDPNGFRVLVRHPQAGGNYTLMDRPPGTEDLANAYLIPVVVPAGKRTGKQEVVEESPSRTNLAIWDGRAQDLLDQLFKASNLDANMRAKLKPIVDARREIGRIDVEIAGLKKQQVELDHRANETRKNLEAIKKDRAANALRKKLNKRLDDFTKDADKLGRKIVELNSKRLEKKIELEDVLEGFELRAPERKTPKKK